MSQYDALKAKICGTTLTLLDSKTQNVRSCETTMGNFVTDAVRELFQSDVVIVQGGSIRGDSLYLPNTNITYYDITREFPFPNVITMYKLKGQFLKQALEEGIRHLPNKAGCFPQVSGIP
jgi:2',3'-cyclic-nucleotide 2'-phosphodiesterase (5'-nucleotidase family)